MTETRETDLAARVILGTCTTVALVCAAGLAATGNWYGCAVVMASLVTAKLASM